MPLMEKNLFLVSQDDIVLKGSSTPSFIKTPLASFALSLTQTQLYHIQMPHSW